MATLTYPSIATTAPKGSIFLDAFAVECRDAHGQAIEPLERCAIDMYARNAQVRQEFHRVFGARTLRSGRLGSGVSVVNTFQNATLNSTPETKPEKCAM